MKKEKQKEEVKMKVRVEVNEKLNEAELILDHPLLLKFHHWNNDRNYYLGSVSYQRNR